MESDKERQRKLNLGWQSELLRQDGEKAKIIDPQDEDNCAPRAVKILILIVFTYSQLYQYFT